MKFSFNSSFNLSWKRLLIPLFLSLILHALFFLCRFLGWNDTRPLAGGNWIDVSIQGPSGEGTNEGDEKTSNQSSSDVVTATGIPISETAKPEKKIEKQTILENHNTKKSLKPSGGGTNSSHTTAAQTGSGSGDGSGSGSGSGTEGTNLILAQIRSKIERSKHYPPAAKRMEMQGTAHVHFRIDNSGQPQEIVLKSSSGFDSLDQEALTTIRRAAPYPLYSDPLEIGIHFEFLKAESD